MNLTVKSLKVFRALQEIIKLDLVPSNFNPFILIKCPVTATIKHQKHQTTDKSIKCPFAETNRNTQKSSHFEEISTGYATNLMKDHKSFKL